MGSAEREVRSLLFHIPNSAFESILCYLCCLLFKSLVPNHRSYCCNAPIKCAYSSSSNDTRKIAKLSAGISHLPSKSTSEAFGSIRISTSVL